MSLDSPRKKVIPSSASSSTAVSKEVVSSAAVDLEDPFKGRNDAVYELFILLFIYILAFAVRLFSVIRYESIIHEFDPWFNFRVTRYLVKEGVYSFHNWFDDMTWYPLGRYIGGTLYPGLMWTAALIYHILNGLRITVNIRNVCVMLAPFMASNTSIAVYLLTKEIWTSAAGVIAAMFVAIAPGYISRSVAGSYDNEAVAIFAIVFTFYLWVKAVKTGSLFWAGMCSLSYFYMVSSWGGYIFIINVIPLHVLILLLAGRYSHRVYVAYCTFFALGTILSMNISFVSFIPVTSPEHLPSIGVFGILQLYCGFVYVKSMVPPTHLRTLLIAFGLLVAGLIGLVIALSILGYIPFLTGRLLSLLGSTSNIAIVKSVSEHQPSSWTTFFFDLHALTFFAPVGIYFLFQGRFRRESISKRKRREALNDVQRDAHAFILLYIVFASYFSSIMVRLVLVLTPSMCVVAAIGVSETLRTYLTIATRQDEPEQVKDSAEASTEAVAEAEAEDDEDDQKSKSKGKPKSKLLSTSTATAGSKKSAASKAAAAAAAAGSETKANVPSVIGLVVVGAIMIVLASYVIHCNWVTSNAYSSPSVILQARNYDGSVTIFDDFREAYAWLRHNTLPESKILSWWDYGYQITGFANRTVIVDNNTRNNTHIATVGLAMASTEEMAYPIWRALDVDYVLVVFGGKIGYSSDDINKFLWMVRISGGVYPRIVEEDFFSKQGQYRVDREASKTMKSCMMYKMCYYRFGEGITEYGQPTGFDRVRHAEIGEKNISFKYMEEAFTSEHWMVRIYRVLKNADHVGGVDFPRVTGAEKKRRGSKKRDEKKKDKKNKNKK